MRILCESEIGLEFSAPTHVVAMLSLHPQVLPNLRGPESLVVDPPAPIVPYSDAYGNRCSRVTVPAGLTVFRHSALVEDSGLPDVQPAGAVQHPIHELPNDALLFLLGSRYCEVDSELREVAWAEFAGLTAWNLARAIREFAHRRIKFDYMQARSTRTALDAYRERVGVCRDYMHLAVTLCRIMNLPARYCTGYLGDIGVPVDPNPMDFSAWYEVYLGGQWHFLDARHNKARIGRTLVARGRDAADVALTTAFGSNVLKSFRVVTEEVPA